MLKKLTGTLLLGAMLVFGANAALAQPAQVDFGTSTGNDTLFTGIPGSIIFTVDAAGARIAAMTWSFAINYGPAGANIMGPIAEGTEVFASPASDVFESKNWNALYGNGNDPGPDSMLYGFVDFGGPLWDFSGEVFRITFTPLGEGTIRFDSIQTPPANVLSFVDDLAQPVAFDWLGLDKEIVVITKPNEVPVINDCGSDVTTPVVFGQTMTATIGATDLDGTPSPLTYNVVSATNLTSGLGPNNAPTMVGNVFTWVTDNVNQDDVGDWEFCVEAFDGLDADTCCFNATVISAAPFYVCLEEAEALSNSEVEICINGLNTAPVPLAGGFDFLLEYDASVITLLDVMAGTELAAHGWEYFTYRIVSTNPAKVRIVAIADMNNSNVHPDGENPDGCIAVLRFKTTNDRTLACQKAYIRFEWDDCGDNTISDRSGDTLFIVGGPVDPVIWDPMGDIDLYHLVPDPFGWSAGITADGGCDGTQKQAIVEFISFCNGSIRILCPGEIDDRGDMNLNGLAYEIADAVLYSRYFIVGTSALDPVYYEAQIAASDINGDGSPLTVADLVYLIRVITGDVLPVPEDGGGLKVSAAGSVSMVASQQGANVTVSSVSDLDVGAALFVFKYENTEITEVSVAGRASGMDIDYQVEAGELRVLVYNIEDRAKVDAGSGEILNVTTTGRGSVELVSVEAATFMGGALKANVSSRVLPTEYALQQNYPNPFNPATSMALDLPEASDYSLTIYNIAGQVVRTFSGHAEAGTLKLTWNGQDNRGSQVASGVYFYRAQAAEYTATKKMVLMK